ncbi:hypothetical protein EDD18DRAFT_1075501, partial [Armillaria luteobubalina]
LYIINVLQINYTTYDVCCDQDSINPLTCSDVIILANDSNSEASTTHPYWCTQIIRLFHANIHYNDPDGDFEDQMNVF